MGRGKRNRLNPAGGRFIFFLLLVFLAFFATVAYQEFVKAPANNPVRFINAHLHRPGRKVVVCAGDGLVRGQLSFNFIGYLSQKPELQDFQFVNAGISGDLSYNLRRRLEPVIACKPNYIIVFIGTNDLLGSLYPRLIYYYQWIKHLPGKPEIDRYGQNLSAIIATLKQRTGAKIGVASLPMIGETLDSTIDQEVLRYNELIQSVAFQQRVDYLPVYDEQVAYWQNSRQRGEVKKDGFTKRIIWAAYDHLILKKSLDKIAVDNGYQLHSDGIHLNTTGGMIIARQIESFLKK
ncbi:MAG: SGNH/GDSL hydrolase family protein [Bacillota bacterium]